MNFVQQNLAPGLYLVGVPIGTARDITLRALDVLASADLLAAEDTRSLRKLMDIHGIPLNGRKIIAFHDHSPQSVVTGLIAAAKDGKSLAYASEAGMPLIADPGFELVREMAAENVAVTSAPGPSSVTTALALAGLPTDRFFFVGFLPSSKSARRKALGELQTVQATLVLFESPKRLSATLCDAIEAFGPDRPATMCREITKRFEDIRRGTLDSLAHELSDTKVKGELVLLIGKGEKTGDVSEKFVDQMLLDLLKKLSVKDAAAEAAQATGRKKRDLYQRALQLSKPD